MSTDLLELKKRIENIDDIHHKKILEIFLKYNINVSENRNGCFINISNLSPEIQNEITEFLKYINKQEKTLNDVEKIKKKYKKNFFSNEEK
jgi:hypothetical protein|tara:strand:+ start:308 stop:580 length:273 start_codon:yes stop_codon:yes gene_type:complete